MNFDNDGSYQEADAQELHPELEELKAAYVRLMHRRLEIEASELDEAERQAAIEEVFKEQMRGAFLTHALATEADFERLWRRLRDDVLCEHATSVYFQVMDALVEELDDEDDES